MSINIYLTRRCNIDESPRLHTFHEKVKSYLKWIFILISALVKTHNAQKMKAIFFSKRQKSCTRLQGVTIHILTVRDTTKFLSLSSSSLEVTYHKLLQSQFYNLTLCDDLSCTNLALTKHVCVLKVSGSSFRLGTVYLLQFPFTSDECWKLP